VVFVLLKRAFLFLAVAAALSLPGVVGALSGRALAQDCPNPPMEKGAEAVEALG
jgi:hypothetical protein